MTSKNPYELTDEQIENLGKLATYLENLPADYEYFEMRDYVQFKQHWDPSVVHYALNNGGLYENCGTVGCALGHGPAAGILARLGTDVDHDWEGRTRMNWEEYSTRFVPGPEDGRSVSRLWRFLFGPDWAETDNTHRGAAARIRYILAGRRISPTFNDYLRDEREEALEQYQQYVK